MKIEYFEANLDTVVIRFFLMMTVIIGGVFTGQYWLAALGLPLFLSALMAVKISWNEEQKQAKIKTLNTKNSSRVRRAA